MGDGMGIAARRAVDRTDALRGFEMAIRAFGDRVQGADELVEEAGEHLVKIQRAALGVCQSASRSARDRAIGTGVRG